MPIYVPDNNHSLKTVNPIFVTTPDNVSHEVLEVWYTGENHVNRLVYEGIKDPVELTLGRTPTDKNMISVWERAWGESYNPQWVLRTSSKGNTNVLNEDGWLFLNVSPTLSVKKGSKLVFKNVQFAFEKQSNLNSSFKVQFYFYIADVTVGEVTVTADDFPSGNTYMSFKQSFEVILDNDIEISEFKLKGTMSTQRRNSTMWVVFTDNPKDNLIANHPIKWMP